MLRTLPIPLSFLANPQDIIIGDRVQQILQEPFEIGALKRRVLQVSKDKSKAKPAYYIDTRDLDTRLDQVVGSSSWSLKFDILNHSDRVSVIARLCIGNTFKEDCYEELLSVEKTDYTTKIAKTVPNELCVLKAAPNAYKRAAVHYGVGAYLYEFKDHTIYEPINQYREFSEAIDVGKLPKFAQPTPGPMLVIEEVKYLLNTTSVAEVQSFLENYFGVVTLKDKERDDYVRLAACVARISDYCSTKGIKVEELIRERFETRTANVH